MYAKKMSIFSVECKCESCNRCYLYTSTTATPTRDCVDCGKRTTVIAVHENIEWTHNSYH